MISISYCIVKSEILRCFLVLIISVDRAIHEYVLLGSVVGTRVFAFNLPLLHNVKYALKLNWKK